MQYDVLIIGAGIAGLYTAINLPKDKKVLIINKAEPWECNTFYAQGGVTTAVDEEGIASHIEDTLNAGDGLCNKEAVEVLSRGSLKVIEDLINRGFEFDHDEKGALLYTKEAAHSRDRILHAGGDATGRYLHHFLLTQNPHPMLADATVIDLHIQESSVCGIEVLHKDKRKTIMASKVVIASGGVGSLYAFHTNAYSISGDMHGICLDKGIALENMEMLQFHPTVYVDGNAVQKQLLTEALRGEGAMVEDEDGYRFLFDYDKRGELASRDIVSRALFDYAQKSKKQIYLSFSKFEEDYFHKRFPNISKNLQLLGFNLPKDRVPISPAFHYAIGGIKTDLEAKVPNIEGLYAVGEVASTGVHGANRLASNSLLEGLVFAYRASESIGRSSDFRCKKLDNKRYKTMRLEGDKQKKDALRAIMWNYVSIVRTKSGLKKALSEVEAILQEEVGHLLRLRLLTAKEIIQSALHREQSIGVHTIIDE